jgi:hypothetical protein
MRKQTLVTIVLAASLCAASLCLVPTAHAQKGLELLPAETQGLLTVKSLEQLYAVLGIEALRSEYPDEFLEIKAEMIDEIGVDLFDLSALREWGLDPGKPIHVGFVVEPSFATAILLPAGRDAVDFLRAAMEEEGTDFPLKIERHGVEIYGDDEEELAYYLKDDYLVLVVTDEEEGGGPATEAAEQLLSDSRKRTLAKSKQYKNAMKKVQGDADFTFYMGPKFYDKLVELSQSDEMEEQGISAEETKELYDEWGLSGTTVVAGAKLESNGLFAESYTWLAKDSDAVDWYRVNTDPTAFLNRVPSKPMIATVSRLNFAELWESLQEFDDIVESDSIPDFDDAIDDAGEDIGVDLEEDVIEQLDGNFALIINRIQMMDIDAVILLQLTRPGEFAETMTDFVEAIDEAITVNPSEDSGTPDPELLREEIDGVPYYVYVVPPMVEICFGVVDDHLVAASSRLRFQSVVKGKRSFIDEIGSDDVRKTLEDPTGSLFYVDFQKIANELEGWGPMLGEDSGAELISLVREMDQLVASTRMEKDGEFRQKFTFTGSKPEMWKRLLASFLEEVGKEDDDDDDDDDAKGSQDEG